MERDMRLWLQIMAVVVLSVTALAGNAAAHPHEGADWDSIAAQARAAGSLPDAAPSHAPRTSGYGAAAQVTSVVFTLVPVAAGLAMQNEVGGVLGFGGVLLGPSVGYFVGGHPVRGLQGGLARIGLTGLGVVLFGVGLTQGLSYGNDQVALGAVIAAGAVGVVVIGSAVYDMATVRASVDRHAEEVARYRLEGMRAPGSGAPALAITIRF